MPGIVGLITRMPREEAERELLQMVEALCHENFYVRGMWADESMGVYVGWVERKGSFSDGMPLRNERGDVVLVFSGEEFPEPGAAQRLKERGHNLDTRGPSYLVHLYEEDSSFPAGLNGRFHGLLTNRKEGTAVLFNDRYGMHRIYYHESKNALYFGAEAKAILAVRPELRRMNPGSLAEFVTYGSVLENRTLFDGISVLPSASSRFHLAIDTLAVQLTNTSPCRACRGLSPPSECARPRAPKKNARPVDGHSASLRWSVCVALLLFNEGF